MLSLSELQRVTEIHLQRVRDQLEHVQPATTQAAGTALAPRLPIPIKHLLPDTLVYTPKLHLSKHEALQLIHSTQVHRQLQQSTGDWGDTAVSSLVYVTFDSQGAALGKSTHPIMQVSIAGINWAYPQPSTVEVDGRQYAMEGSDLQHLVYMQNHGKITDESIQWYTQRMVQKWGLVLAVMKSRGVQVPVLPAIGLGAFLPSDPSGADQVRHASVAALQQCLKEHAFSQVWVSVPDIGGGRNHAAFLAGAQSSGLYQVTQKSMFDFAWQLAESQRVGIVNASDREALVSGNLGQFWAGGHVALEEVFVYATTMLLNNWFYTRVEPVEVEV